MWAAQARASRRAWRQTWRAWRDAGLPLLAAYLGGAALIALISLWQTYRPAPFDLPLPLLLPLFCAGLLLAALGARSGRPPLTVGDADLTWLRSPAAPWAALLWPLLRTAAPWTLAGIAAGSVLLAWHGGTWALASALPLLALGVPLVRAGAHAARLTGRPTPTLLAGTLLPLAGLLHPALLPAGVALSGLVAASTWRRSLHADLPPRLHRQLEIQALRTGARRLGLPAPVMTADGHRPARPWSPPLRRATPAGALLWRAALSVLNRPLRLLPALLGGAALAAGAPALAALPLTVTLELRPPTVPAGAPLDARAARLVTSLPAGVGLGAFCLLGALLAGAGPAVALTALLSPWAAHAVHAWLVGRQSAAAGQVAFGAAGEVAFGAALTPALLGTLCGAAGLAALAPVAVLGLGVLCLLAPPLG